MTIGKIAAAAALSALLVGTSASSASAHCYRHCGPIGGLFGLAGAIVVGAATIATAPLVIAGDVLTGGGYERRPYYGYGPGPYYGHVAYGYGPRYYGPPRPHFYYGPRRFHRRYYPY